MSRDGDPNDPLAARSPALCAFFAKVMRRHIGRQFHALRIAHPGAPALPPTSPVIIYTNHPSWWDPAVFIVLHSTLFPERAGFGPMDETALQRYGFMRRLGIFGVEPGTRRGAAQFMRASSAILGRPSTVLWVTAQGAFTDARVRPVQLAPGVAHLMQRWPRPLAIPLALDYVFWDERYPEALCRFGAPLPDAGASTVDGWRQLLEQRLTITMEALTEDAVTRDPARFHEVQSGRVGIGGVYDLWRRLRASWHGQVFEPGHRVSRR